MAEWSKAPDSRSYFLLSRWGFWSPHGGVGSNPTSDTSSFWIGSIFETVNIIVSIVCFAIWPMQIFNILVLECQNGHSAITPNSRRYLLLSCWGFWSPHGGVGSNPTSDEGSFIIGSVFESVNIIVSIIYFAIWPMPMIELSLISLCQQVRMAERSKAPDSRLSPSQSLRFLVSTWRRGFKSHFWHKLFLNWKHFWDSKHYSLYCLFCHLTNSNL